jgi:hypothetical protein
MAAASDLRAQSFKHTAMSYSQPSQPAKEKSRGAGEALTLEHRIVAKQVEHRRLLAAYQTNDMAHPKRGCARRAAELAPVVWSRIRAP